MKKLAFEEDKWLWYTDRKCSICLHSIKLNFQVISKQIPTPHGVLGFWGFGVLGLGFRV